MPNPSTVILKRLRVHQDSGGEIQAGRAPRRAVDPWADPGRREAWWDDVLSWDRRLKLPEQSSIPNDSPDAWYRLDRYIEFHFEIACECGGRLRGPWTVEQLLANFGPDANTVYLARHLIDCKSRNKVSNGCRAYPVR
jgi:hypothetical protein